MILVFDLDDTLYDERQYVESGLRSVAEFGHESFGWDTEKSLEFMNGHLESQGRGAIFDAWLASHGKGQKHLIRQCVRAYRHHQPNIQLYPSAKELLKQRRSQPLYVVTDGHKIVQTKKVEALGIEPLFRRIFISHRFGLQHAKPSTYCFKKICALESCNWSDIIYVGDNPAKDFVNLNKVGAKTVRVLTGAHKAEAAAPGFDAEVSIADLGLLDVAIREMVR